jgi:hypothetical protein
MTRIALIVEAYIRMIAHDVYLSRHNFAALHQHVKTIPTRQVAPGSNSAETISSSLEIACCFYPKRVQCLQRSAVLIGMLRSRGLRASMIIGAQKLPFRAHAWVEVDGHILNDRLASREKFLVMEVC